MWICDDSESELGSADKEGTLETVQPGGEGANTKPPGYYVTRESGLFPAPLQQDSAVCTKAADLFWFLGSFLAKTLQDNRLVDLPLSRPFLKLLCQGEISRLVLL